MRRTFKSVAATVSSGLSHADNYGRRRADLSLPLAHPFVHEGLKRGRLKPLSPSLEVANAVPGGSSTPRVRRCKRRMAGAIPHPGAGTPPPNARGADFPAR